MNVPSQSAGAAEAECPVHAGCNPSLTLAEACAELCQSPNPHTLFQTLSRALHTLVGPNRYRLWKRIAPDTFEAVSVTPAAQDPPTGDGWYRGTRLPASGWEQLLDAPNSGSDNGSSGAALLTPAETPSKKTALAIRDASRLVGAVMVAPSPDPQRDDAVACARILTVCATSVLERLDAAHRERDIRRRLAALETGRDQERCWMQAVCESARGVAGEWDLGTALDRIVNSARLHLDVERACVYRYLPDECAAQLLVGLAEDACPDRSMPIESLDRLSLPLQAVLAPQRFCLGHAGGLAYGDEPPGLCYRGTIAVPIVANGQVIGAITAENPTTGRELPDCLRGPLALLADFAAIALTHARRQREIAQSEAQKKQFYRDILCAVTNGKLTLCERDEIEQYWSWPCVGRPVRREEDIRGVREVVTDTGRGAGLPKDRVEDLCLCASEAATNALKHAGGGEAYVVATSGTVRVRIEDRGGGIDPFHLPRATLMKGYSTRASMGLGFTLMHELADRLYLNTSVDGTTVILEMSLDPVTEVEQILSRLSLSE